MKAILVACLLAACAFAFAIGVAQADTGGATAAPSQSAPATQPVQQDGQQNSSSRVTTAPRRTAAAPAQLRRSSGSAELRHELQF